MEETLGKRIAAHRKRLGMTQDKLAEALGVTAQAVSKWENDQSCPDITTLPRLAEIFGVTTDELLGLEKKEVHVAEVVTEEDPDEPEGFHVQNGPWEFQWDGGRKSSVGFALWVLLVGSLLLASNMWQWNAGFFDLLWTSGLLLFGLFGLYPKFSVFRLGCALFGGYSLYIEIFPVSLNKEYLLPAFLLLFGLSLLVDALCKHRHGSFHVSRSGKSMGNSMTNSCTYKGEAFSCTTAFGNNEYLIRLPRLSAGEADVCFGEMTVDLSGCASVSETCTLDLDCSFGQLVLLIPRRFRAEFSNDTAFGAVEVKGTPAEDAEGCLLLNCDVSFGQILLRYI